jgi:hypothetical protein
MIRNDEDARIAVNAAFEAHRQRLKALARTDSEHMRSASIDQLKRDLAPVVEYWAMQDDPPVITMRRTFQ